LLADAAASGYLSISDIYHTHFLLHTTHTLTFTNVYIYLLFHGIIVCNMST